MTEHTCAASTCEEQDSTIDNTVQAHIEDSAGNVYHVGCYNGE